MTSTISNTDKSKKSENLNYYKLFWVFMIGCIIGVLIEGAFCVVKKGHWESHVVSVFGDFNILYGMSCVLFYVCAQKLANTHIALRLLIMIVLATVLELLSGLILRFGLGMKAWAYTNQAFNFMTIICPKYSLYWGVVALFFCLTEKYLTRLLCLFDKKPLNIVCIILSVFMFVNLSVTSAAFIRWSARHYELPPSTEVGRLIDEHYTDEYMDERFMDWRFFKEKAIDEQAYFYKKKKEADQ